MSKVLSKVKDLFWGLAPTYVIGPKESPDGADEHLIAHTDKNSFIAEQYKLLCRKLFFLSKESEKSFQTILFTSCQPREGKTTTSCNLALTLSIAYNKKTLLVDADLRRSSVHRMFGIPRKPGLVELVRGEVTLEGLLQLPTVDGLHIIPAGSSNSEPGEIFQSRRFVQLIDEFKTRFNYILIDSPPILKVSDASTVGGLCDAVFFVVKAGGTPRETIREGLDTLEKTGAAPSACILVNTSSIPDYYSYLTKRNYREYYRNRYIEYGESAGEPDQDTVLSE